MDKPTTFINVLAEKYKFHMKGTRPLKFHLGADCYRDSNGILAMAPCKYIDCLISSYKRMFGEKPKMSCYSPLEKGDHPELDDTELLDQEGIQQY